MTEQAELMTESELRAKVKTLFDRIQGAFDEVDPDVAECEESLGSLTIHLPDGAKWILSVQPPVRQIWLAVASIGRAYHFAYDPSSDTWRDIKGEGIELMSHLQGLLKEQASLDLKL